MGDTTCIGEHTIHICELASKGKHVEIKEVTKYPKFMCMNCGRVAELDKNLCNPTAIEDIRPAGT